MIRVIIAEDERPIRDDLRTMLEATGRVSIMGEAKNGTECLRILSRTPVDALLLDIRMPGASGIDVARAASQMSPSPFIAFITAYSDFALKAFDVEAVDYVLKPFDVDQINRLLDRIQKALDRSRTLDLANRLDRLQEQIEKCSSQPAVSQPAKIPIKDYKERTIRLINPADIVYVRRQDDRTHIRTKAQDYPTYYSVDQVEARLSSQGFLRINSGTLVNSEAIEHVIPNGDSSYDVVLSDKSVHTVSRRRAKSILPILKIS